MPVILLSTRLYRDPIREMRQVLTSEMDVCDALMKELAERHAALERAQIGLEAGEPWEQVERELRAVCPMLLVQQRCGACGQRLVLCPCP